MITVRQILVCLHFIAWFISKFYQRVCFFGLCQLYPQDKLLSADNLWPSKLADNLWPSTQSLLFKVLIPLSLFPLPNDLPTDNLRFCLFVHLLHSYDNEWCNLGKYWIISILNLKYSHLWHILIYEVMAHSTICMCPCLSSEVFIFL